MGAWWRLRRYGLWWRKRPVVDEIAETMTFGAWVQDEITKTPYKIWGIFGGGWLVASIDCVKFLGWRHLTEEGGRERGQRVKSLCEATFFKIRN